MVDDVIDYRCLARSERTRAAVLAFAQRVISEERQPRFAPSMIVSARSRIAPALLIDSTSLLLVGITKARAIDQRATSGRLARFEAAARHEVLQTKKPRDAWRLRASRTMNLRILQAHLPADD